MSGHLLGARVERVLVGGGSLCQATLFVPFARNAHQVDQTNRTRAPTFDLTGRDQNYLLITLLGSNLCVVLEVFEDFHFLFHSLSSLSAIFLCNESLVFRISNSHPNHQIEKDCYFKENQSIACTNQLVD